MAGPCSERKKEPRPGPPLDASTNPSEGSKEPVILSEAKDHLEMIEPRKMILRSAQDDSKGSLCMTVLVIPNSRFLPSGTFLDSL